MRFGPAEGMNLWHWLRHERRLPLIASCAAAPIRGRRYRSTKSARPAQNYSPRRQNIKTTSVGKVQQVAQFRSMRRAYPRWQPLLLAVLPGIAKANCRPEHAQGTPLFCRQLLQTGHLRPSNRSSTNGELFELRLSARSTASTATILQSIDVSVHARDLPPTPMKTKGRTVSGLYPTNCRDNRAVVDLFTRYSRQHL